MAYGSRTLRNRSLQRDPVTRSHAPESSDSVSKYGSRYRCGKSGSFYVSAFVTTTNILQIGLLVRSVAKQLQSNEGAGIVSGRRGSRTANAPRPKQRARNSLEHWSTRVAEIAPAPGPDPANKALGLVGCAGRRK